MAMLTIRAIDVLHPPCAAAAIMQQHHTHACSQRARAAAAPPPRACGSGPGLACTCAPTDAPGQCRAIAAGGVWQGMEAVMALLFVPLLSSEVAAAHLQQQHQPTAAAIVAAAAAVAIGAVADGRYGHTNWDKNCDIDHSGAFGSRKEGMEDLAGCVARVKRCEKGFFASFSAGHHHDCSWSYTKFSAQLLALTVSAAKEKTLYSATPTLPVPGNASQSVSTDVAADAVYFFPFRFTATGGERGGLLVNKKAAPDAHMHQPIKTDDLDLKVFTIVSTRFTLTISTSTCTTVATVGGHSSSTVPFLALYNPPAADQAHNFEPCVSAELLGDRRTIRVVAAHDLGHIDIAYNVSIAGHVYFTLKNISNWLADPDERHLQFGTFWAGLLDNSTAPVIMGKVQGPRGIPGTGTFSAGFVTVTENAYYRWIFGATVGDEVAFSFAGPSSFSVAQFWQGVGAERGLLSHNPNRFLSWFWTQMTEESADVVATRAAVLGVQTIVLLSTWASPGQELVISNRSFPSGIRKTVDHVMAKYGIKVGIHMHPDIVWPCIGTTSLQCLTTGIGKAPMVTDQ
eukprot:COSAG05_NODE_3364_length_2113_cov_2.916584_1_plen_568_part_10